ncbi:MAG TPA: restriction endonuclease, partial [Candidatus Pacearchaeota archaeon]|nr:restriction endonuclease [Candidatus Pacearchaeota archaeon]
EVLTEDVLKEIYSFYPDILLTRLDEEGEEFNVKLLELPKLIEEYSNNEEGNTAYLFEDILVEGFNMFHNVSAKKISGAGNTDIECLYITLKKKFAVEAKSTKNKLPLLNSGRLNRHREKIGGEYTIVVTPRYVPSVKYDIKHTGIVIITASTFSEFLYNNIANNCREIDYTDFDDIITQNLGKDISIPISELTIKKFASSS